MTRVTAITTLRANARHRTTPPRYPIPAPDNSGEPRPLPPGNGHSGPLRRSGRPRVRSADVGQCGCERLHHQRVVRCPEVDDAHVGAGVLPRRQRWLQRTRIVAGVESDIDRALDLGRIAPDVGAVPLEDLALAPPLIDIAERRVPVLGVLGDDAQRAALTVAADGDRRVRALHLLRLAPCLGEREMLALERRPVLRQQLDDDLHALLELVEALLERWQAKTKGIGLVLIPAGAKTDDQATLADDVDGGGDVRQHGG